MYSLWDEASKDVESENRMRRLALAESDLDQHVFSFVALSSSEAEYNHRKALVSESLERVAERTGASLEEVNDILDTRMGYILEARKLAAEQADFLIVDSNDVKVGGPYADRESAQAALSSGKYDDVPGAHVIPAGSRTASAHTEEAPEGEHPEEAPDGVEKAARLIREALEEGKNPLDWVRDLPSSGGQPGETSEHSEDSDPSAQLPGGDIPPTPPQGIDSSGWARGKSAGIGDLINTFQNVGEGIGNAMAPMGDAMGQIPGMGNVPGVGNPSGPSGPGMNSNNPGPSPHSDAMAQMSQAPDPAGPQSGLAQMGSLDSVVATMSEEIARFNPQLSRSRVESIARKVASRYLSREGR